MGWLYHFVNLTSEQKHERRHLLDLYASIAQISVIAVIAIIQLYYLLSWISNRFRKEDTEGSPPSSPYIKARSGSTTALAKAKHFLNQVKWWSGQEIYPGFGTKGKWMLGAVWTLWLLFCSMHRTGDDYLHLTKRFGIIGASQLPLHYLLAIKSPYSPAQFLTRTSHEELNAAHQILGRIIHFYFILHTALYLNFFVLAGVLGKRIKDRDVIIGILASILWALVGTTALSFLRKWNYRVFYGTHVVLATALLPLLYFHVHHIRIYIWETLAVYILHSSLRYINSRTYSASVSIIPDTTLIEVSVSVPKATSWKPGQHVYLQVPSHPSTPADVLRTIRQTIRMHTNPFSIANIPARDGRLQLVARIMSGNTAQLADIARYAAEKEMQISLTVEGPYGAASHLPDFARFESVLLVAGGVGATFCLPVWKSILSREQGSEKAKVRFVWAVRKLAETEWAFEGDDTERRRSAEIYVTGGQRGGFADTERSGSEINDEIEFEEREHLMSHDDADADAVGSDTSVKHGRPDLANVVDQSFASSSGSIAVLMCGPSAMSRKLRREVGRWVRSGRDVYWHAENFGL